MDQSLYSAAQLNNQGIQHMRKGDFVNAVTTLTTSLRVVKELMALDRYPDNSNNKGSTCHPNKKEQATSSLSSIPADPVISFSSGATAEVATSSADVCPVQACDEASCCQDMMDVDEGVPPRRNNSMLDLSSSSSLEQQDVRSSACLARASEMDVMDDTIVTPYIHRIPLLISPRAVLCRDLNEELLAELSVAVLFNLALCYQLQAFSTYEQMSGPIDETLHSNLIRSVSLYELAYGIQMQEDIELSVESTMAIINNLGQLHRFLGNEEKATKCFAHLLSTLLFVQSADYNVDDYSPGRSTAGSTAATEGFVQSVSYLILKKQVAAAA